MTDDIRQQINDLEAQLSAASPDEKLRLHYKLGELYVHEATSTTTEQNLAIALTHYQAVLDGTTALTMKMDALNNIGIIHREQARLQQNTDILLAAIDAFEDALSYATTDTPVEHVMVLNNLGNAYHALSEHTDQQANLQKAIEAAQTALTMCSQREYPDMYAALNNNLGNLYVELSELDDTYNNLQRALDAYQETLLNTNPNKPDATYATMQNNVGNVCRRLAEFEDRDQNLQRALTAYREAGKVITREGMPLVYATLQANIGIVQSELKAFNAAADAWREAADIAALFGAVEEAQYFAQLATEADAQGDHTDAD